MKSIEKVRIRLNRAISTGRSKDHILTLSKLLDDLIVEQMILLNIFPVGISQNLNPYLKSDNHWLSLFFVLLSTDYFLHLSTKRLILMRASRILSMDVA
jgi:hypothetical protein